MINAKKNTFAMFLIEMMESAFF